LRRSDKEITDRQAVDKIIHNSLVCHIGLCREGMPYVVPVSFGYDGVNIFIHTAAEGMKTDIIAENNNVCFEFERDVKIIENQERGCGWTFSYSSVIGFGKIAEITGLEEKASALNKIMLHYSQKEWELPEASVKNTRAWAISVEQLSGKQSKDKINI